MGAVNTTYTFTATDTITSTKMNNIIDETVMTSDAVLGGSGGSGGLDIASGKLSISNGAINSSRLAANSVVTAAITDLNVTTAKIADSNVTTAKIADSNVTTAKIADTNVTQAKLAANVVGNGPTFSAYQSVSQSFPHASTIKVTLGVEDFDSNSNFASSRFTPTVAGYYLITGVVAGTTTDIQRFTAYIAKNGTEFISGTGVTGESSGTVVSTILYLNGSSDYVELFARHNSGSTKGLAANRSTSMSGCLIRSA
jgi:calcineurin-like phosphoesterase